MRNVNFFWLVLMSFSLTSVFSQEIANIKTIQWRAPQGSSSYALAKLDESITISFDDLNANEIDYYYTITHCNWQWEPSDLLKSEYMDGLDDLRIEDKENSFTTLQPFTHYQLTLPNAQTRLLLTGNYIITITNSQGDVIFTRRFSLYGNDISIAMQITQSRSSFFEEQQNVNFKVIARDFFWENPRQNVKIAILQNHRWEQAKIGILPQFISANQLIYKYDQETSFDAGNEFFYFDNKEILGSSYGVSKSVRVDNQYHTFLFSVPYRANLPYTYAPDINGKFQIHLVNNKSTETEYSWVHFSLEPNYQWLNDEIFVYGDFSDYCLCEPYQLQYNKKTNRFEGEVLLKQGFYNYKFARKTQEKVFYNAFAGSHYQTENDYTVLVYYRPEGVLYDRLIGASTLNSIRINSIGL